MFSQPTSVSLASVFLIVFPRQLLTPFPVAGGHLPPALVGPRARVELPRPELPRPGPTRPFTGLTRPRMAQPNLAPRGDDNNGRGPSTPRAKYYTNPHHGPSRYSGWFEHVRGTTYGVSDKRTRRLVLSPPGSTCGPMRELFLRNSKGPTLGAKENGFTMGPPRYERRRAHPGQALLWRARLADFLSSLYFNYHQLKTRGYIYSCSPLL